MHSITARITDKEFNDTTTALVDFAEVGGGGGGEGAVVKKRRVYIYVLN